VRGQRFRTSLTVRVPPRSSLSIDNRNGGVTLSDLEGDQSIDNAFGEVVVRGIDGNLALENRNGNVTVESVTGSVVIDNAFALTSVRNVGGNLALETRNGNAEVSDIGGDASIENAFASVEVANVTGALDLQSRNSAVDVANIGGNVEIENAFQSVRIRDVRGELRVTNRNGDVSVRFPEAPAENVFVSTEFSNVTIEAPADSAFSLDLFTRFGEIESDFGPSVARDGTERSLVASVGAGGPSVRIRTRNGNVRLDRM
jgi:hypothetical protein